MNDSPYLVNHFLEHSAHHNPDKVALICDGQRLTYARIEAMANKMANALLDNGVNPGDRVIIFLPNSVELVVSIFAVLKAQAVFAVINPTTKQDKLLFLINNCRAKALILPARQRQLAETMHAESGSLKFTVFTGQNTDQALVPSDRRLLFDDIQDSYEDTMPPCGLTDQDLACLIYTSGSTGDPKGVMSGHDNVVFAASSIITYLENRPEDIVLNVLPLSFDYGLYQLLMTFKFGGTLVLEKSFTFPAQILGLMTQERVTGFPGVPIMFSILLNMDLSSYSLNSLRYITNTAAALPSDHIRQIINKFPGVTLYSMYGLTETKRTLYLPPDQLPKRPDSVGIPIPGTEAWVEDESGNRLGPNQTGELIVRGRHVMRGYWENPEATARRFRNGSGPGQRVCRSGDLFRVDEDGYFYFVGRMDDIIKSRGEKVAPKEVEAVLYQLPDVVEAAVIGVSDTLLGQSIKAFVVTKPGSPLTEKDLLRHCRSRLEDFMIPQLVEFRQTLPKNPSGKIQKSALI